MIKTKFDELIGLLKQIHEAIILRPEAQRMPETPSPRILDNADVKQMLKIGDTKLYYLKKKRILKPYKLDGKDVYLESEVIAAIKGKDMVGI